MKKFLVLLVVGALGVAAFALRNHIKPGVLTSAPPPRLPTARAELRNIRFAVMAAGEITPAEQVSVRPEINGKIDLLPVDLGDQVKRGDLLFKLDDKELQQQRASNLTDVERARIQLEKAGRDFDRARNLAGSKLISQELFEDTKTTYELAKVALERAQTDLAVIEERLTKTEVRAPFDCTVLTRPVSIGQAVSGSGGFNSGTEVLTIADLNSMIINAHVNQADVPRLKLDQIVEVAVEAVSGLVVTGAVERIAPQATIKNNIKGYAARIVLRNPDPRVRPGMTANVRIPVATADNVTAVPLAAVYTEKEPQGDQMERFVYVQRGDAFEKRPVKVGVSDYFFAEIQGGLTEGEVVALELPQEERDKKSKQIAGRGGDSGAAAGPARGSGTRGSRTNAAPAGKASQTNTPAAAPAVRPRAAAGAQS